MIDKIIEKIFKDDFVSFLEVERIFDEHKFDYKGSKVIRHPKYHNLVIWAEWSEEAVEILEEIVTNRDICLQTTHTLIYFIDGNGLTIPVAKNIRDYKIERWLPMVLRPDKNVRK
ncbi:hypothetical protein [Senegalia sp. (in: firmicutes)]|uniref:hypothetical protein n=1 Tax=Senegalia sp. (in: firmicutes) TaxID=1924098 RepID=UPI003F98DDB3